MIDGIQGYPDGFVRLGCPWTEAEESSQGDQEGTILEKNEFEHKSSFWPVSRDHYRFL